MILVPTLINHEPAARRLRQSRRPRALRMPVGRTDPMKGTPMSWKSIVARPWAIVPVCAVAATMVAQTGVANAASRGYRIHNEGSHALKLEKAAAIPTVVCNGSICVPTYFPMEFEGRPANGSVLKPSASDTWELKYGFGYNYAAAVTYKVEGTGATFETTLETSTFSNNSTCKITPSSAGTCTAKGLNITVKTH
jgi:hypothetical protein